MADSIALALCLFLLAAIVIAVAGTRLAQSAGLSHTLFGSVFTAITTSLPELITVLAAVRRQAYTLAVGDIIGGNTFDVLFLAFSDLTYRPGSIYHTLESSHFFLVALTIAMVSVLLLGLLRRERHGLGGIGFESIALLVLYTVGMAVLWLAPA